MGITKRDYRLIAFGLVIGLLVGYVWGWNSALDFGIDTFERLMGIDLSNVVSLKQLIGRL